MKTDYHMHSTISDGRFSPTAVMERAAKNGVEQLALTDHDDLSGWIEAHSAAQRLGLRLITGVEISTTWHGKTIHVLGYGFRPLDATFKNNLDTMRAGRGERSVRIAEKLAQLGYPNALAGAQAVAGRQDTISRTHFARWMVQMGHCQHFAQAMNHYLADGAKASVAHEWCTIETAVQWIREAGGMAVLAHPVRYKMPKPTLSLADLINHFVDVGGGGLEVVYNQLGHADTAMMANHARQRGLAASRGSDFHTDTDGADIGAIPPLPTGLIPLERLLHN